MNKGVNKKSILILLLNPVVMIILPILTVMLIDPIYSFTVMSISIFIINPIWFWIIGRYMGLNIKNKWGAPIIACVAFSVFTGIVFQSELILIYLLFYLLISYTTSALIIFDSKKEIRKINRIKKKKIRDKERKRKLAIKKIRIINERRERKIKNDEKIIRLEKARKYKHKQTEIKKAASRSVRISKRKNRIIKNRVRKRCRNYKK